MNIPFSYSLRNLQTRKLTTALTASGMALVVFVFSSILMLSEGLRATLVNTGSFDNVVVLRRGSTSEVQSGVPRDQAAIVTTFPEIRTAPDGSPLVALEMVVLINLPRRRTGKPSNVVIRGIDDHSFALRPQVKLVRGRMPRPGSTEIVTGNSIEYRFKGTGIGETLRFGMRDWIVVGVFDAANTGYGSEIWGDAEQMMQAFRRNSFSSVLVGLSRSQDFEVLQEKLESDPRIPLEGKRESEYYAEQSEMMTRFLRILGTSLTVIFSIGAVIGAMITMYTAVANRVVEIGTLRALGFSRKSVMVAFLMESLLLGSFGGIAGLFFSSFLEFFTISTTNFQTFSELAFRFTITPGIAIGAMAFSLFMGFAGGVLPAFRAARMNISESLR